MEELFLDEIILQNKDGEILASSREVAEKFGKNHKDVLRSISIIEGQMSTAQFCALFIISEYKASNRKSNKEYLLNRDGFSLLCMGFTGKSALEWKLKYIEAFNKMEKTIKSGNYLSEEEKLKLQLFSKDTLEVVSAHNKLTEIEIERATAPLIAENQEMRPKAEFHDAIETASNCINFGKFAAILQNSENIKIGRNIIMDWCRENGYLCSSYGLKNKPSQQMLSHGYMQYKENISEFNSKLHTTYTPLLTGKGQIWLTKQILKEWK